MTSPSLRASAPALSVELPPLTTLAIEVAEHLRAGTKVANRPCSLSVPAMLEQAVPANAELQRAVALAVAPLYLSELPHLYGAVSGRRRPSGLTREVLAAVDARDLATVERDYRDIFVERGLPVRLGLVVREGDEVLPSSALRSFLAGRNTLPTSFGAFAEHRVGEPPAPMFDEQTEQRLARLVRSLEAGPPVPVICLHGASGTGRTLVAQTLSRAVGLDLIKVHVDRLPEGFDPLELVREADWLGTGLLLRFSSDTSVHTWQRALNEILEHDVAVFISVEDTVAGLEVTSRSMVWLELPRPDQDVRRRLWQQYLPQRVRADDLTDEQLAFRFRGVGRTIARLAQHALDEISLEAMAGGERRPRIDLARLGSISHRTLLGDLGQLGTLEAPLADGLAAVVLPDHQLVQLREVLSRVRNRRQVMEAWGFERRLASGVGTLVLMSGPPGTGKTLSARAVASELGIPLYRVELSRIVSKWVGETEKHLARIFDAAEASGAAMLFDEADALFARRTEVKSSNDRYANLEVNYLLQRVESFSGVCFLTTNMTSSLDPAFIRRMSLHLQYELPGAEERTLIWRRSLPEATPLASTVSFGVLARAFDEMSGGEIRNACLRAAYIAAEEGTPITHAMLAWCAAAERAAAGALVRSLERPETWDDDGHPMPFVDELDDHDVWGET